MAKDPQFYQTFDSADGPTIPEGEDGSFDHRDSMGGLKTDNEVTGLDLEVPEIPSVKR